MNTFKVGDKVTVDYSKLDARAQRCILDTTEAKQYQLTHVGIWRHDTPEKLDDDGAVCFDDDVKDSIELPYQFVTLVKE